MQPLTFFDIALSFCGLVVGTLLIGFRRQRVIGDSRTLAYAIALSMGAVALFVGSLINDSQVKTVLIKVSIYFISLLPALVIIYILFYIFQSRKFPFQLLLILDIFPTLIFIFSFTQYFPLIFPSNLTLQVGAFTSSTNNLGRFVSIYSIGILAVALLLISLTKTNEMKPFGWGPMGILNGTIIASIIFDILPFTSILLGIVLVELMLVGFLLIGLAILNANLKNPEINLITRDELFNSINDGIILLDNLDRIIDLNPVAEKLIGVKSHLVYGIPVETILTNWKDMTGTDGDREKEFRGSINLNNEWHHINVRIGNLENDKGTVIILRDVTDQRDSTEIRQRAREEIFNLLRSFFKSANTSQTSNDFFRDVLFQIAYTFRAESGAIALADTHASSKKLKLSLMAKHGELVEDSEFSSTLLEAVQKSKWINGRKEPLLVTEIREDKLFGSYYEQYGNLSVAIFPLLNIDQFLGILILGRSEPSGFSSDEIVRLGVVTEELASFIYSDRKRKADIAMAERHRLAQDLHDSITQKLCGLVTLTEAVKLGLESGAPVDENKMMERISENARQALREMRLFLYELEPVDVERDGLVSTLQQRLASVEGRSDIQARMITEGEILLSAGKETEIYYIVEEALNNILKHANAKSVQVKVRQKKNSVYLEIIDNGCGFDLKQVKLGGRGLNNMQERAKRIQGSLKINSAIASGTKITLVVPQ